MALSTYTELKAAIATQLSRSDLTTPIVDAITLTEAKVQRVLDDLNQETRATATVTEYMSLPTSFLTVRDIQLNLTGGNKTLEMISPSEMDRSFSAATGEPAAYCLIANQIQVGPAPDGTYTCEIVYKKYVPVLSGSNASNWLLTAHPDVYLYGGCFEALCIAQDYQGAQAYKQLYSTAINDLIRFERKQRWSGPPMRIRAA